MRNIKSYIFGEHCLNFFHFKISVIPEKNVEIKTYLSVDLFLYFFIGHEWFFIQIRYLTKKKSHKTFNNLDENFISLSIGKKVGKIVPQLLIIPKAHSVNDEKPFRRERIFAWFLQSPRWQFFIASLSTWNIAN